MKEMKASELMVGDWVQFTSEQWLTEEDACPLKVTCVGEPKYPDFYPYIRIEGRNENYHIDLFQPIPLTTEILEKNGFENGKLNISPQYYLEDKDVFIGVTLKDIPDKHKGIDIAKGRLYFQLDISRMEEPLYVHQLQHVLKLCGIDKTIEL